MPIAPSDFGRDSTMRWSPRAGDYIMWTRCTDLFAQGESAFRILDFWEIRDGDAVTMTNRMEDLPAWFELHPTEARGVLAYAVLARLEGGWAPGEPLDGPNLWRAQCGDRLVWVDPSAAREGEDAVRALVNFRESALVFGESTTATDWTMLFGAPSTERASPEVAAAMRSGFLAAVQLGLPRSVDTGDWGLG
jgi:hypothetical protein